jgi:4-hydroxy-tetrahydrodipicolinate synthase
VDKGQLRTLVNFLLEEGVHGLVSCGSTGEFPMLTYEERRRVTEVVADEVSGRVPVVEGVTAVRTDDAVMFAKHAKDLGLAAIMAAPSYYFKLGEEALHDYYSSIAKVGIPVVVYNNPSTTKVDTSPSFLAMLSKEFSNIQYVKESTGDIRRVREIQMLAGDRLSLICGEDPLAFEFFALGAAGWISTASNAIAKQCVRIYDALARRRDLGAGLKLMDALMPAISILDGPKGIQAVKAGLRMQGVDVGQARKPLLSMSERELENLRKELTELGLIGSKEVPSSQDEGGR